jgi:hypothetical protein
MPASMIHSAAHLAYTNLAYTNLAYTNLAYTNLAYTNLCTYNVLQPGTCCTHHTHHTMPPGYMRALIAPPSTHTFPPASWPGPVTRPS